jgi:hypothetical protein
MKYLFALVTLVSMTLVSCGGGDGGSSPPPPSPSFSVQTTPASIQLLPGLTQTLSVTITRLNGFSGAVNVTVAGVPSGISVSPIPLTVDGSSANLTFTAGTTPAAGDATIKVTATSGTLTAVSQVALTVANIANPAIRPFTSVGGQLERAYYDESRHLLFATNPAINEVEVFSGADLTLIARLSVPQPVGIDQMSDGQTLVVGTLTQGIYTIQESTLAITRHLAPNFTRADRTMCVLPVPVALANGKVLIIGREIGVFLDYIYGGQHLIEWNSITGQFQEITFPNGTNEIDNIKRSLDHKWAVFYGDGLYIYSSDADSYRSVPTTVAFRDVAASPTGTQFVAADAQKLVFFDRQLNVMLT